MAQADVTRIASNIGALNSLWALNGINKQLSIHQNRLATGKRINSAEDDPAGLTIATKLNSRSEGLKVSMANIGDAKNLMAVAEAGVGRITDIMVSMKNKASQAGSDTMGTNERAAIYQQLAAYTQQIDDIVTQTEWNGNPLINGKYDTANTLTFLTGANSTDTTTVNGLTNLRATAGGESGTTSLELGAVASGTYTVYSQGVTGTGSVALNSTAVTGSDFRDYMAYVEGKLDTVNGIMAKIGAFTGRLSFKEDQVAAAQINVEASYSRIMNANMAEEQVNASKFMVLQQTSMAMLAQANQSPQFLLSLFR